MNAGSQGIFKIQKNYPCQLQLRQKEIYSTIKQMRFHPHIKSFFIPNFVETQQQSFYSFLEKGLIEELTRRNPITDVTHDLELLFYPQYYQLNIPELTPTEAILKGKTYACRLYVPAQLTNRQTNQIKLQWVLLGNLPLMTKRGHFIINGSPRVIINQLVRSPGIYYQESIDTKKKRTFYADLISQRGAWLRLEIDKKRRIWVRMKKMPKIPALIFLQALGFTEKQIKTGIRFSEFLQNSYLKENHPKTRQEALVTLYEIAHPNYSKNSTKKEKSQITAEMGEKFLFRKFMNPRTYNLSSLGRFRLNEKFGLSVDKNQLALTPHDIFFALDYLIKLEYGTVSIDDIDNLKNRRVRASGELIQNQFSIGLLRLEKVIREKLKKPKKNITIQNLITTKPINGSLREFFGSSPLSQYMDQTNPLSEITHKRRLSSLGPGGISRETAGMAVRGIHPTHYGRICPIETPEGRNAGLVNSITIHSKINNQGFLKTPFYKIYQGQAQKNQGPLYFSAKQEEHLKVAPGDLQLSKLGFLPKSNIPVRLDEEYKRVSRDQVDYVAISPLQMISVATSLIPFLEHDDANRALMGSNMQRQAVPVLLPEPPIVGTGLESRVAGDSGHVLQSKTSGYVSYSSGQKIIIQTFETNLNLKNNLRPVQSTFNSFPLYQSKIGKEAWFASLSSEPLNSNFKQKKTFLPSIDFLKFSQKNLISPSRLSISPNVVINTANKVQSVKKENIKNKEIQNLKIQLLSSPTKEGKDSFFSSLKKKEEKSLDKKKSISFDDLRSTIKNFNNQNFSLITFILGKPEKTNSFVKSKSLSNSVPKILFSNQIKTKKFNLLSKFDKPKTLNQLEFKNDIQINFRTLFFATKDGAFGRNTDDLQNNDSNLKELIKTAADISYKSNTSKISINKLKRVKTNLESLNKTYFQTSGLKEIKIVKTNSQGTSRKTNIFVKVSNRSLSLNLSPFKSSLENSPILLNRFVNQMFKSNQKEGFALYAFLLKSGLISVAPPLEKMFIPSNQRFVNFENLIYLTKPSIPIGKNKFDKVKKTPNHIFARRSSRDSRVNKGVFFAQTFIDQDNLISKKIKSFSQPTVSDFINSKNFLTQSSRSVSEISKFAPSGETRLAKFDFLKSSILKNNESKQNNYSFKSIEYQLQSYRRSNQNTCLIQKPAVKEGEWIQKGDLLADCAASVSGELSLGKNLFVAYMPWEGYNFEDAILINERLVYDDVYTSLHIERYDIEIRDTQFGLEQITNQITEVNFVKRAHLDHRGVAKLGSWVKEGDILVGKITPIKKRSLSPHEKLLYDIIGKKIPTTRDTSLRVPKGVEGRVISIEILDTDNIPPGIPFQGPGRVQIYLAEKRRIQIGDKMAGRHGNKGIVSKILPRQDMPYLPNGTPIDIVLNPLGVPSRMNVGQVFECLLGLAGIYLNQQFKIPPFDESHGPEASRSLVFSKLYQARLKTGQDWLFNPEFPGKTILFDGRTGESFDQFVTVGQAYILKLVHLVDEKIHARSTGPYSLVTQQPLGGRSKHGGQRLGEMEVWALEGFGAAYTLQELLTVKSDDIKGRHQVMDAILNDDPISLRTPESFKVLIRELQCLCLDVEIYRISPVGRTKLVDIMKLP